MDDRNVYATWKGMCEKNEDVIWVSMQVKELVDMKDRYVDCVLNRRHVVKLLNVDAQSNIFNIQHCKCIYFIFSILF